MVNLKKIKNNINDAVDSLSANKLAELYFQERKRYIKLGLQGRKDKAIEVLKRNDKFFREHHHRDPHLFHQAHHKYIEWYSDYQAFRHHREILMHAKSDQSNWAGESNLIIYVKRSIESYLETEDKEHLTNLLEVLNEREKNVSKKLLDVYDGIRSIEKQIEDNEFYREHDHFRDVDPLGFRDLSVRDYFDVLCNQWTNNGPCKLTGEE